MTVTTTRLPETPAEVAAAVLDAIEARPAAFDMSYWVYMTEYGRFTPDEVPDCGTTMCAAGWTAHLTGWTLVRLDEDEAPYDEDSIWAEKDGLRRQVDDVARESLGLGQAETFWYSPAEVALARLREIAGR